MIEFLKDIIVRAGKLSLEHAAGLSSKDIEFKSRKDIVTTADKSVEEFIKEMILKRYPEHTVIGEETGKTENMKEYSWIVDPIDGTSSFVHGQPFYSVSIALYQNNETVCSAVYAPVLNQLFHAQKGRGAYLNDDPIQVSSSEELVDAIFATGFACLRANLEDNNLKYFNRILPELRDIRRYGSAAIDLCYVACGKLDGFWEMNLNIHDIAAGILIVREAGGLVYDFKGGSQFPELGIIASNAALKNKFLKFFKD